MLETRLIRKSYPVKAKANTKVYAVTPTRRYGRNPVTCVVMPYQYHTCHINVIYFHPTNEIEAGILDNYI